MNPIIGIIIYLILIVLSYVMIYQKNREDMKILTIICSILLGTIEFGIIKVFCETIVDIITFTVLYKIDFMDFFRL